MDKLDTSLGFHASVTKHPTHGQCDRNGDIHAGSQRDSAPGSCEVLKLVVWVAPWWPDRPVALCGAVEEKC
jgi:hypothetical protein